MASLISEIVQKDKLCYFIQKNRTFSEIWQNKTLDLAEIKEIGGGEPIKWQNLGRRFQANTHLFCN